MSTYGQPKPDSGGLLTFAGVMILAAGIFNVVDGLVAIVNSDYLSDRLLFSNLNAWGWFFLIYGSIQVLVGMAVFTGARWAQIAGIVMAGLNAVAQLAFLRSNPAWSIIIMVVDGLIIYALTTHGAAADQEFPPDWQQPSDSSLGAQTHSRLA